MLHARESITPIVFSNCVNSTTARQKNENAKLSLMFTRLAKYKTSCDGIRCVHNVLYRVNVCSGLRAPVYVADTPAYYVKEIELLLEHSRDTNNYPEQVFPISRNIVQYLLTKYNNSISKRFKY